MFTSDSDPYGERDFGVIPLNGETTIFWKIDTYDADLQMHSPDPSDPAVTTRVLTDHAGGRVLTLNKSWHSQQRHATYSG